MTTTTKPSALHIATLRGGDPNGLACDDAIWFDLEGPSANEWCVMVESRDVAEVCAHNASADLVSVVPWDGSPFGDGACGCVASPTVGVIVAGNAEFLPCDLPKGWQLA